MREVSTSLSHLHLTKPQATRAARCKIRNDARSSTKAGSQVEQSGSIASRPIGAIEEWIEHQLSGDSVSRQLSSASEAETCRSRLMVCR